MNKLHYIALAFTASFALAACSSSPNKVSADGKPTAEEISWPKYGSESGYTKGGIYPSTESLQQLQPGIHKRGVENLLGNPHYTEMFGKHEWTFAVHFHTPNVGIDNISTCQLKVFFDKQMRAQSFYWNPIIPKDGICPPPPKLAKKITLSADALFSFNGHATKDILPGGREKLDQFVVELKQYEPLNKLTLVAHTDRLGNVEYNYNLSYKRAQTIRGYLSQAGIPADIIYINAAGKMQPIKECDANLARAELIKCLQPNRRVEVFIN